MSKPIYEIGARVKANHLSKGPVLPGDVGTVDEYGHIPEVIWDIAREGMHGYAENCWCLREKKLDPVDAICSDADGWIEWKGGECPVPLGTLIDIKTRGGKSRESIPALEYVNGWPDASYYFWISEGHEGDIIAYRIVKPAKTPLPVTMEPDTLDATLDERGKRYGSFVEHAKISQALTALMHETVGFDRLLADQCEALEMIAHKIARILNGDPNYVDSWTDIAGYAKLVADRLQGVVR